MRRTFLPRLSLTLLAATSILPAVAPAIAQAQNGQSDDRIEQHDRFGTRGTTSGEPRSPRLDGQPRVERAQPQPQIQPQIQRQQTQFSQLQARQPQPQPQPRRDFRPDGRQGQIQPQPQAQPQFRRVQPVDGSGLPQERRLEVQALQNGAPPPATRNYGADDRRFGGDGHRRGDRGEDQRYNGYSRNNDSDIYNERYRHNNHHAWNNDWRRNNYYNWRSYRSYNRDVYRLPRYYAPYGYGYRYQRFSIGYTLNALLFGQSYWIGDPVYYRLPPAYGPYRWVRYYDDALLVDIRNGRVVDVVYGIFW